MEVGNIRFLSFQTTDTPSNVELKIAKYIRFNTPKKSVIIQKEQKEYFTGNIFPDFALILIYW